LWPINYIAGHILHTPYQRPAWSLVTLGKSEPFYVICWKVPCNVHGRKSH